MSHGYKSIRDLQPVVPKFIRHYGNIHRICSENTYIIIDSSSSWIIEP